MTYLNEALQRIRTGITISWENGYYIVRKPYDPAAPWETGELKTKSAEDALFFYRRWVEVALGPREMTPQETLRCAHMWLPAPIGGDDRLESESEQTGLGVTPGWWRPEKDKEHYD